MEGPDAFKKPGLIDYPAPYVRLYRDSSNHECMDITHAQVAACDPLQNFEHLKLQPGDFPESLVLYPRRLTRFKVIVQTL